MSYVHAEEIRQNVVQVAHMMHQRGYIGGLDGNISVWLGRNRFLCTPASTNKGFLNARDLVVVDLDGKAVQGKGRPSSELAMHLLVYRERPDVQAVIHAHPQHCVACTLVGLTLTNPVVPEMAYSMGAVPTAPYATPGTKEVPDSIEPYVKQADGILLARHGSLTMGTDLWEAYNRLEGLEHAAQILFLARNLGELQPLNDDQVARLRASVEARDLPWRYPNTWGADDLPFDEIIEAVVERLERG